MSEAIKATVKRHDGDKAHVADINLLYHGDDVILLQVPLHTKYKTYSAVGGATDPGVQAIWVGMDEIQLTLPDEFKRNIITCETSRYEMYITIFKYKLLVDMTDAGCDAVELWSDGETW